MFSGEAIFENSMDAILITAPDGRIFAANPAACLLFGRTEAEIISIGRKGIIDQSDIRLKGLLVKRKKMRKVIGEITFLKKDGTTFQGEFSSSFFKNEKGNVFTIVIIRDITSRRLTEETLHLNQEILHNMSEGIQLTKENDSKIIFVNPQFEKMFGYEAGELIGKNVSVLNAPTDRTPEEIASGIVQALKKSGVWAGEILNRRKDNSSFWCSVIVTKFTHKDFGNIWIGIHQDISEQKQANSYNRSLIEATLDPLVTINIDGKILDVNRATQIATGLSRDKLIGTDFSSYFTDPEKARTGYKKVFSAGSVRNYSLEIKSISGKIIPVLYNASVYHDLNGNVLGILASARDVTELKNVEDKLRKSSKELRQLAQHLEEIRENEKTQIAHDLHDDLGQKLTALNMDISWISSRIGVQSQNVRNKIGEMVNLLNETIDSTRKISFGLRPSILDDLGLRAAIEWQLIDFNRSSDICYSSVFKPEEVIIDKKISLIVFRIVQEALTNVARHSHATNVALKLHLAKTNLKLSIKDNGIGIDENKVMNSRSFGLMGMKERLLTCNGELEIKTKAGQGTEISVSIPIVTE
jgi:PAS domain S-box-containing protein